MDTGSRLDDDADFNEYLEIKQDIRVVFKQATNLTKLEVLLNGEAIETKPSAEETTDGLVHIWSLAHDIPVFPNFNDKLAIRVSYPKGRKLLKVQREKHEEVLLVYKDLIKEIEAQEKDFEDGKAISISNKSLDWTVQLNIILGDIENVFTTVSIEDLDPLLPAQVWDAIATGNTLVDNAKTLKSVFDELPITENVMHVIENAVDTLGNAHPLAKAVLTALSIPYNMLKTEHEFKQNIKDLADAMQFTGKCLLDVRYHTKIGSARETFMSITKTLRDAALYLEIYQEKGRFGQFVRAQFPKKLEGYAGDLTNKKNEFQMAVIMQIARDADKTASLTSDDFIRKRLVPVQGLSLDEGCLEGTRIKILQEVTDCIEGLESTQNILWIEGAPGAGKSTIATTIAKELAHKEPYCVKFFCKRDVQDLRDPRQIWRTLAYGLASVNDIVKSALMQVLDETKGDLRDDSVVEQFEKLIKGPLETGFKEGGFRLRRRYCPVVIIDALDECYAAGDDTRDWMSLLRSLKRWASLSSMFKLIITSRNLPDILRTLGDACHRIHLTTGEDVSEEAKYDVKRFFEAKFAEIQEHFNLPPDWPSDSVIRELTNYAAGLFIWADMVVKFVGKRTSGSSPTKRLEDVLSDIKFQSRGPQGNALDGRDQVNRLYARIVFEALRCSEPDEREHAKRVLAIVVLAKEPLRKSDLVELLTETSNPSDVLLSIESTLQELSPIIPVFESDGELRVCHKTVSDFLLSHDHSSIAMEYVIQHWNRQAPDDQVSNDPNHFILDCEAESGSLALECLRLIRRSLSKDINVVVENLQQPTRSFRYARQHWMEHLEGTGAMWTSVIPNFKSLGNALEIAYGSLERYVVDPAFAKEEAEILTKSMQDAASFASRSSQERIAVEKFRQELDQYIRDIDIARGNFQIESVVRLAQDIDKSASNAPDFFLRKRLQPADQTLLDSECVEGTRTSVLRRAKDWLDDTDLQNILWIVGVPGAGKSAIATSLVSEFSKDRLCAKVFVKRDYADRRDPARIWRTFAYELANLHSGLKGSIMEAAYDDLRHPVKDQSKIRDLVVNASRQQQCLSVAFVIDALDECFTEDSEEWRSLLRSFDGWAELPRSFKLVITSRDIPSIRSCLEKLSYPISLSMGSDALYNEEARHDIKILIRTKLAVTHSVQLSEEEIEELTDHASGSFIWAKMVTELVGKFGAVGPVKEFLNGNYGVGEVDVPYGRMLLDMFGQLQQNERDVARSILAAIVLAKDPLRKNDLVELVALNSSVVDGTRGLVDTMAKELSSIISVDDNQVLRIPHKSFCDFLLDYDRSFAAVERLSPADHNLHSYLINPGVDNTSIAIACLQIMNGSLKFNACGIDTSHLVNDDLPELQARIVRNIRSSLIYASHFWAQHLRDANCDEQQFLKLVEPLLKTLLCDNLLYWLEILSLVKAVPSAMDSLVIAANALEDYGSELSEVAKDAYFFVKSFEEPITAAASHIYLSALPFCPSGSWITKLYGPRYANLLSIVTGRSTDWEPDTSSAITDAHEKGVNRVAYSPDGRKLVSGSDDNTVRVWDVETGQALSAPLDGHDDGVHSVAVSPDGKRIASGDFGGLIILWNWDDAIGVTPERSISAHKDVVYSIAFSPDGSRIVSGSKDFSVKVWNVATGDSFWTINAGHSDVNSVAFSPDGNVIASGSDDGTVRIWDTLTGRSRTTPLTEHVTYVLCVAFSVDGRYFASSSDDMVYLYLWDGAQGFSLLSSTSITGDKSTMRSICFSPDSSYLVSGSASGAICFWDVRSGECKQIGEEIYGHSDIVESVAFAPDGRSVASGSNDRSVKIWTVPSTSTQSPDTAVQMHSNSVFLDPDAPSTDPRGQAVQVLSDESYIDSAGWMRASRKGRASLLFWVPEENRQCIWWPRNTAVIHSNVTKFDFGRFVHGEYWAKCRTDATTG